MDDSIFNIYSTLQQRHAVGTSNLDSLVSGTLLPGPVPGRRRVPLPRGVPRFGPAYRGAGRELQRVPGGVPGLRDRRRENLPGLHLLHNREGESSCMARLDDTAS